MKKILLFLFLLLFSYQIFSLVYGNDIVCAFNPDSQKADIETNVIDGALLFLKSKANADLLLQEYEKSAKSAFNFFRANDLVNQVILDLESSRNYYIAARDIGKKIGYVEKKISWFRDFDYDSFITENLMNREIAEKVKKYLVVCDIIGIYNQNVEDINSIIETLYAIKEAMKSNTQPDIKLFWRLLQQYSEAALFGNYATVIGSNILTGDGPPICLPD